MSFKRTFGLDWFDVLVHVGITGMVMIIADSASVGDGSEGAIAAVVAVSLGLLAWRRARGLKRLGPDAQDGDADRLHDLESRVADLEAQHGRVLELEERLDFAERMLAQHRDREQLGRGT